MRIALFTLLILFTHNAFSWNGVGHRLVALIAYQHLNPDAKRKIDTITRVMFHSYYGDSRFMKAAIWADKLRYADVTAFNNWHFIDLPYTQDNVKTRPENAENVAWAVMQSEKTVGSVRSSQYEKAMFLNFLVHFVADMHQPLHCISRYSKALPNGDQGGNLYLINSSIANNLHGYWDRGLGLFYHSSQQSNWSYRVMTKVAAKIVQQYPPNYFAIQLRDLNPYNWAQQSYNVAKNFVYTTAQSNSLSSSYTQRGQEIVKQRIALAGYRLAAILNQIL